MPFVRSCVRNKFHHGIQSYSNGGTDNIESVYFAIPKNGLCTFSGFFKERKWKYLSNWDAFKNGEQYFFFGHIQNPYMRHVKGLTETAIRTLGDLKGIPDKLRSDRDLLQMLLTSVNDEHCSPITKMLPPYVNPYSVNWIPLDYKIESEVLTNQFFDEYGFGYKIKKSHRAHVSGVVEKEIQEIIRKELFVDSDWPWPNIREGYTAFFNIVLAEDLLLYEHVLRQYDRRYDYLQSVIK